MKIAGLFAGAVLAATAAAAPAWADIFIDFHDAPDSLFVPPDEAFIGSYYEGVQTVPSLPAGPDLGVRFNGFEEVTVSVGSTLTHTAYTGLDIFPEGVPFIVIKGAFKHVSFDYAGNGTFDARVGVPVDGHPFGYFGILSKPTALDTLNTISFDVTGVGQELDLYFNRDARHPYLFLTNLSLTSADSPTDSVPEPATWALMIGGFGLAGGALRHRRGGPALGFR
ncbi:PEPxxWA-CTERM sorting domain-containing protein [Phenylobacterium sp.]|uniref:PEPxxWA-CTERM sorting domain-containing protein n=1 Tax=Phenylobacterium sp. TaxID=1871053 RepID=UPI0025F5EA95|nr:PEPxxWA-CTERM sorting domain-containing protein [Phenylobacterium sp.]